jgi:hypothetical protein
VFCLGMNHDLVFMAIVVVYKFERYLRRCMQLEYFFGLGLLWCMIYYVLWFMQASVLCVGLRDCALISMFAEGNLSRLFSWYLRVLVFSLMSPTLENITSARG